MVLWYNVVNDDRSYFATIVEENDRDNCVILEKNFERCVDDIFTEEISNKLKTYVYRLIDPRNGETFYVGKGKGNRVFYHIRAEENLDGDDIDNKMKRIREIRLAGFEVAHVIHRHGMDEKTAFEVEAALIDAYPGLTNIVSGTGANEYGVMHADEIIRQYSAEEAVLSIKHY